MMTRIFGHYVPNELLLLWLLELTIGFLVAAAVFHNGLNAGLAVPDAAVSTGAGLQAYGAAAVLAASAGVISFAIGLYRPETFLLLSRVVIKTLVAGLLSAPVIWLSALLLGVDFSHVLGHGAWWPLDMLLAWLGLLLCIRLVFSYSLRMNFFVRRIVVLGQDASAQRTIRAVGQQSRGLFEVTAALAGFDGTAHDAQALIEQLRRRRIWGVVISATAEPAALSLLEHAAGKGPVKLWREREFWESQLRRVDIDLLTEADLRLARGSHRFAALVSRLADIVLSLFLLALTLPLMLLTALAIKLDSPGPVFYRQERVGLDGVPFILAKFRSMRTDAETEGPVWAAKGDSRVTRIGALMRATRIDELPQLINVLQGKMSFIGPRPERPHFVGKLAGMIPFYEARLQVRPGLTGWAQVNYPYGASTEDARMKLSYDLYYVRHRSILLDVLILFSTIRVILFQEGAR
jgi:exopolysaccharide biosynthesis polyprenyl glycosylphosphotransferase